MTQEEQKAAADKEAADKAAAAKAAAAKAPVVAASDVTARQKAIADAKKLLADAEAAYNKLVSHPETTLAQDQAAINAAPPSTPLVVHGNAGGPFNIRGEGFGGGRGTVMISGMIIPVTAWDDKVIRGTLPANLKPGAVVVQTLSAGSQKGTWPTQRPTPMVPQASSTATVRTPSGELVQGVIVKSA